MQYNKEDNIVRHNFINLFQLPQMNEKRLAKIRYEFGKKVREIRLSKNLTQLDLAAKLGIDVRQVRRIENGENETSLSNIYLLSEALNVKVGELFEF
jgi:ribosome-binding protein aMBF1 (putative translation factor)